MQLPRQRLTWMANVVSLLAASLVVYAKADTQGHSFQVVSDEALEGNIMQLSQDDCTGSDVEWGNCPNLPKCPGTTPIDCKFGSWGEWYDAGGCSGLRFRQRSVATVNNEFGKPCTGSKIESERYMQPQCSLQPVNCAMGDWSEWSHCAKPTDQKTRSRSVTQVPARGGDPCKNSTRETLPCGHGPKPKPCVFTTWGAWTSCSASCGGGRRGRTRDIRGGDPGGATCTDSLMENAECNTKPCPSRDCILSDWSAWEGCTFGESQRYRQRVVNQSALGNGLKCDVPLKETVGCSPKMPANCEFSSWTKWTECHKTCDGGQAFRTRKMEKPNVNGGVCPRASLREAKACGTVPCGTATKADCTFAEWGAWSNCSVKCGKGSSKRIREVKTPAANGGRGCLGPLEELHPCDGPDHCSTGPQDCLWSEWFEWSACSCTCGGGTKYRSRNVQRFPMNGGAPCQPELKAETVPCNTKPCSGGCIDGAWGEWMPWTSCSASCDGGYKSRHRDIAQHPNHCGKPAEGYKEEFAKCTGLLPCIKDVDCSVSTWGQWSQCSCSCFGVKERNRFITRYATGKGKPCTLSLKDVSPCNPGTDGVKPEGCKGNEKVQDCEVSEWGEWMPCSKPCDGGQKMRHRKILKYSQNGGKPCVGDLSSTEPCNTKPCHHMTCVDAKWSTWSDWSDCTKCGGQRYRHRSVTQLPNHCGKMLSALSAKEVSNCSSHCSQTLFCSWSAWTEPTCPGGCGAQTTLSSRTLGLSSKKPAGGYFVVGGDHMRCFGTQLNQTVCPLSKSCKPDCVPQPCVFGAWTEWTDPTCLGLCERTRSIKVENNECGTPCSGPLHETKRCGASCEVDCVISNWSPWSACPQDDTAGQRYRQRTIETEPKGGGKPCEGILRETKTCSVLNPAVDCELFEWSEWSDCECDEATYRTRKVKVEAAGGGAPCEGSLQEIEKCTKVCIKSGPADCAVSDWESWSQCSQDGQMERARKITTFPSNGGEACMKSLKETIACSMDKVVDCEVSDWTTWATCTVTCGIGQHSRVRQIKLYPEQGGKACPSDLHATQGCNLGPCSTVDCKVSKWSEWTACSTTCDVGLQQRFRKVISERQPHGAGCNAELGQTRGCEDKDGKPNPPCVIQDCLWNEWEEWSGCTCTCGGGQKTRNRHIGQVPALGGKPCEANDKQEIAPCNTKPCPTPECVDGQWDDWMDWSPCSASCNGGERNRKRKVKRMANDCGTPVSGNDRETEFCNVMVSCVKIVDCLFTEWGEWGDCSASCDGVKRRSRRVGQYGRGQGKFCIGPIKETVPCNPTENGKAPPGCSAVVGADCVFGEWEDWSTCPATCGGAQHVRHRSIKTHHTGDGLPCQGPLDETAECARKVCSGPSPVNCAFGEWDEWGACDKCSGQRKRFRHITQHAENGGQACVAFDSEETGKCPRACGELAFCTWTEWQAWGACSEPCGVGRRKRERKLHLTVNPAEPPPEVMAKYEDLVRRAHSLQQRSPFEFVAAFMAGFLVLASGLGVIRVCSTRTTTRGYFQREEYQAVHPNDVELSERFQLAIE